MSTYIKRFEGKFQIREEKTRPTIAVSGFSGTGKSTFSRVIADELDLEHIKPGRVFRELAEKEGVSLEELSKRRDDELDLKVDKKMLKKAIKGGCVLDGRLTAWVAGDHADLRIYLETDPKIASKRVADREDISEEEALQRIKTRDKSDRNKYEELYDIDLEDLTIFDFVINNDKLELAQLKQFAQLITNIFE